MADDDKSVNLFSVRRVLVTSADRWGTICRQFEKEGADVIGDAGDYERDPVLPQHVVEAAGKLDILVVNLLPEAMSRWLQVEALEEEWQAMFNATAQPTAWFVRADLQQTLDRTEGEIIVITSTPPLRGVPASGAYTVARGAQNAQVRAVGGEIGEHNVQINAIAQNFFYGAIPTMPWRSRASVTRSTGMFRHAASRKVGSKRNWFFSLHPKRATSSTASSFALRAAGLPEERGGSCL